MQINLENLAGLERKLNVTVPAPYIEDKVKAKLAKIAREVKMPGFRPGKVPADIVQQRYAGAARGEVLENLIRETYTDAIKQHDLEPAGLPNIKIISSESGEPFVYDAIFEVYPTIKLNDLDKIKVEKATAKIEDNDVTEMLEKMRKERATWQKTTDTARKSQVGDQLVVDYTIKPCDATVDLEPSTEKNVKFVLGDGSMWSDFEQPLHEVSAGEEKSYNLQFPATHMDKKMAGNRMNFTVKVHEIHEPILPELDDEFAEKMHIKEGGLEGLKGEIRTHIERDLEGLLRKFFKDAVLDKLLESNPIEVPKALVENELRALAEQWQKRFAAAKGKELEQPPVFPRDNFVEQAKGTVALRLLLSEVIKEHNIRVELHEVRNRIDELVSSYYEGSNDKDKMINKIFSDEQRVAEIEALLMEEKVIAFLETKINTIEKAISYKEAIAKRG